MDRWLKQTPESPLFPDLDWEKPERKDQAGKLLIVGGNLHGFAAVAEADQVAKDRGIGSTRIMLPDSLRRTLAPLYTDALFCPSTATGSFNKESVDLVLQNALWADGVLLPGDLGRNSETAILIDTILSSLKSTVAITRDALDYYIERPAQLVSRDDTILVASFAQAQKLLTSMKFPDPLVYTMPVASLVGTLTRFTDTHPVCIVVKLESIIYTSYSGKVSTTKTDGNEDIWRLATTTRAVVNVLHHPRKVFEAVTASTL